MDKSNNIIGIFDSGLGGLSVWNHVAGFMPAESFVYCADSKFAPYGYKSNDKIIERSHVLTKFLIGHNAKLIIVACNTATAAAIESLRNTYPDIQFVGMEPAVKPASLLSKTGNIGVLATHGTFNGKLFKQNQEKYKPYVTIHYTEGAGLVELAEQGKVFSQEAETLLKKYLRPLMEQNVDQLVLGCTHYPLFIPVIEKITGGAINIIHPADAIAKRAKDLLMQGRIFRNDAVKGKTRFYTNGNRKSMDKVLTQLNIASKPVISKINY
ncbi:MAG: glutamate racemase [Bacteroidales bacterium]